MVVIILSHFTFVSLLLVLPCYSQNDTITASNTSVDGKLSSQSFGMANLTSIVATTTSANESVVTMSPVSQGYTKGENKTPIFPTLNANSSNGTLNSRGFLDQAILCISSVVLNNSKIENSFQDQIINMIQQFLSQLDSSVSASLIPTFQNCSSILMTLGVNGNIVTNLMESLNNVKLNNDNMANIPNLLGFLSIPNLMEALNNVKLNNDTTTNVQNLLGFLSNPQSALANLASTFPSQNVSRQCSTSFSYIAQGVQRHDFVKDIWALQIVDAFGKPEAGLLSGNGLWAGDFDECLRVEVPGNIHMSTQYCKMHIAIPALTPINIIDPGKPVSIQLGVCVPRNCTSNEIQTIVSTYTNPFNLYPWAIQCHSEPEWDTRSIVLVSVIGFIAALVLFATIFDGFIRWNNKRRQQHYEADLDVQMPTVQDHNGISDKANGAYLSTPEGDKTIPDVNNYKLMNGSTEPNNQRNKQGYILDLLISFSALTNLDKMFNTHQGSGALGAVNGIRFLSMTWVILGHSYGFISDFPTRNILEFFPEHLNKWTFMTITNGLLSVDTFFLLSGLLVSYLFLKEMTTSNGKINWFLFYFHRFWRLTPPYMMMLWVSTLLSQYISYGPNAFPGSDQNCEKYWWRNLIYINNFYPLGELCFGWSWYLANDMQFYIISPLILLPLYFSKRVKYLGTFVTGVFLLGITIATIVVSVVNELPSTLYSLEPSPNGGKYFDYYYLRPYCRMGPYLVGLYLGYILFNNKCKSNINKYKNMMLWFLAAGVACAVMYGTFDASKGNHPSVGVAALYNGVSRTLWAMCVAWVIYACVTGNGGYVNTLLSWKAFIPLGRLTYCAYLVHPTIIFIYLGSQRQPFDARDFTVIYFFFGNLVASYLLAVVISLLFEAPMIGVEKTIFKRNRK